jgi:hypothetical protein
MQDIKVTAKQTATLVLEESQEQTALVQEE